MVRRSVKSNRWDDHLKERIQTGHATNWQKYITRLQRILDLKFRSLTPHSPCSYFVFEQLGLIFGLKNLKPVLSKSNQDACTEIN
jgi:hypothetical protein